ncbi:MAG: methionine synthase [Ruminococcus sp.]|jgi:5-methyltetrahydrofolate--homocysteine methyltransferase|nr:methionine synthase [Ruminococcus sp.]
MNELKLKEIDITETLYYLGFKGTVPEPPIMTAIKKCEAKLLDTIKPQYVIKISDIEEDSHPLIVGNDIHDLLSGCQKAVFFCCTLGSGVDRLISYAGAFDISDQLYTDALANAAVEQVCDMLQQKIASDYPEFELTMRFSPGYGDYPLEIQPEINRFLDAPKRIGVTVTDSLLMNPTKSVSAVIGLKKRGMF